ncbi:hypothetical protein TWF225_002014 [Orbilia oligospora]|nr:hypothetical protein TWF225_002014 [Orbilia oligospora]KAF3172191.1 hypothetical protein TWF751_005850 [Orbilia oligospora]KAF3252908.1 hypothetical protein TWF217_007645 [Orbilia oligospora]KAF3288007.1 hypothetical protein TWF132_008123 [Orbilia oligospora]
MPVLSRFKFLFWILFSLNAGSIPVKDPQLHAGAPVPEKLDSNHKNAVTQQLEQNKTDIQRNTTPPLKDFAIINSTDIIPLNTSIFTPVPLEPEYVPYLNQALGIENTKHQNKEVSISGTKEDRYFSPTNFYTFKLVCPSLSEIIGDGPDPERRMNQDPKGYRSFASTPKNRPSATEDLEAAGLFFKVLLAVQKRRHAREDISDAEALDIYRTLDNIPDWIKRKFPNHRFSTLDGLSLAWQRDGWGRPNPLPVGILCCGQVVDPDEPAPIPEYAPDTIEPFPLYGPGPSDTRRDYQWLMSSGPGLWGIGDNSYYYYKRDTPSGSAHGADSIEGRQEGREEDIPESIKV